MTDLYEAIAAYLGPLCPSAASVHSATSAVDANTMALGSVPVVLVVPAGERWSPPPEAGLRVTVTGRFSFSCIVALTFPGGVAEWSAVREELRAALLGWTPEAADVSGPVEASGARLLAYDPQEGGRWLHAFDFNLPAQTTYGIQ